MAEKLGAPIVKALLGKDCVPDDSPFLMGGIGVVGTRPSQEAMEGCDALLIVGSSFPYVEFLPSPGQAKCVQIDDRPERIGLRHPTDVALVGDSKATLRQLRPESSRPKRQRLDGHRGERRISDRGRSSRSRPDLHAQDNVCWGEASSFGPFLARVAVEHGLSVNLMNEKGTGNETSISGGCLSRPNRGSSQC